MKSQLIPSLALLFASAAALSSCGNAGSVIANAANKMFSKGFVSNPDSKLISKTIALSDIRELSSSAGLKVTYVVGESNEAVITAPADLMEKIKVDQSNGEVSFVYTENISSGNDRVSITVTTPVMTAFDASSASTISLPDGFTPVGGELSLQASSGASLSGKGINATLIGIESSSGASINVSVNAESVACDSSSGSSISISGKATSVKFSSSSGGSIWGAKLNASTGSAQASSGGSVGCAIQSPTLIKETSGGSVHNEI